MKSKSKLFRTLVDKIDTALSESDNFDQAVTKLKKLTLKVREDYTQPIHTDLAQAIAMDEFESRWIIYI